MKKTATSAFYITQYFNPDFWNENQYNGYINQKRFYNNLSVQEGIKVETVSLMQNQCQLYNSKYFDMS